MLDVRRLSLRFGGLDVLQDVALEAKAGELTALIGPNGAGKTALLNCITGIYRPTRESEIRLGGRPIQTLAPHRRAKAGISRTFQHMHLTPEFTVLQNVMMGLTPILDDGLLRTIAQPFRQRERESLRKSQAMKVLESCGLAQDAHRLADSLPLGTRRRVDLARAIASDPRVLLLDEPASGMTREERSVIPDCVRAAQREREFAAIWIEHDIGLLFNEADTVHVLQHGVLKMSGRPRESAAMQQQLMDCYFSRLK